MCIIFSPVCNGRCWAKIKKGTDCQYFFHCEVSFLIFLTPCQWFSKGWWDQDTRRICCTLSKWMWRLRSQSRIGCGEEKSYGYGAPWYQNNGDIKTTVISKQRWYQNNGDIKTQKQKTSLPPNSNFGKWVWNHCLIVSTFQQILLFNILA